MSERRAEKSCGPCTINGVDNTGAIGLGFANAVAMGSGNLTGAFGLGLTGALGTGSCLGRTVVGSTGTVVACMKWTGVGLGLAGLRPRVSSTSAARTPEYRPGTLMPIRTLWAPKCPDWHQGSRPIFRGPGSGG